MNRATWRAAVLLMAAGLVAASCSAVGDLGQSGYSDGTEAERLRESSGPGPTAQGFDRNTFDSDEWFELQKLGQSYLCKEGTVGFRRYDCYSRFGDKEPAAFAEPDLYCSGMQAYPDCSELWYPDGLANYEIVSMSGLTYLCERALTGSWGDYDCGTYDGGDPNRVWTGVLKCTDRGGSFECDPDYYPSEMDGLFFTTIGGRTYVCEDTWQGSECYLYSYGSPRAATYGPPAYYCNSFGQCDRHGYP